jgi:spore maturation protein CgeB
MRVVIFCHSLISDWNNGNAHFLRGIATELVARGHQVDVYEPRNAWSVTHLLADSGRSICDRFRNAYPALDPCRYDPDQIDLEAELRSADLVLVHEWNDHKLVNEIARLRKRLPFIAFFHDTHHRAVSAPDTLPVKALEDFDAVLAFGEILAQVYRQKRLAKRVYIWHEAADIRVFSPRDYGGPRDDIVWIGNWGDEERTFELKEYLLRPVQRLRLKASAYGVRYPESALKLLSDAGIHYHGWIPNFDVADTFGRFKLTLHIPRRPYVELLRGIPTIRVFEALACGIPLICSPWEDSEHLFREDDFALVRNADEMTDTIHHLLREPLRAAAMASRGRETVLARHTCGHRVSELLKLYHRVLQDTQLL